MLFNKRNTIGCFIKEKSYEHTMFEIQNDKYLIKTYCVYENNLFYGYTYIIMKNNELHFISHKIFDCISDVREDGLKMINLTNKQGIVY